MKIQYCSDLHLEFDDNRNFMRNNPIDPIGDLLVIAGDLCYLEQTESPGMKDFLQFLSDSFSAVYYIPGNHEFYGNTDIALLDKLLNRKILDNVFLVNNHIEKIGDVVLIFSTLWTHLYGRNIPIIKSRLNDFHLICHNGDRLSIDGYNHLHETSVKFINEALQQCKPEDKIVVITHHLPSFKCIAPEFEDNPLNIAFASNLNKLIESSNIEYWIYGHSHSNILPVAIGGTKLISNTLGCNSLNKNSLFNKQAIIAI